MSQHIREVNEGEWAKLREIIGAFFLSFMTVRERERAHFIALGALQREKQRALSAPTIIILFFHL